MGDLMWLSEAQMPRIEPQFSMFHEVQQVDHRLNTSGLPAFVDRLLDVQ
jgi:hypothetical protein